MAMMATHAAVAGDRKSRWYVSWPGVLVSSLVLPPVGFVLLWLRPWKPGAAQRIFGLLGRLALSFVLVILTLTYLVRLGVLHMEMSGSGIVPIFTLRDPNADQIALEEHRAHQAAIPQPLPSLPVDVAATPSGPVPAAADGAQPAASSADKSPAMPAPRAYWTDFRGPHRDGIYAETPLRTSWPDAGLKPLWRQPIGGGYASFTIANGVAFTIEQRRGEEVVAAYDIRTGRELWTHSWSALFAESMGGDGPRATPTWHEGRVYALGAAGELRCLDAATGKRIWSKNILSDNGAGNITWGMANSPLVVDDKLIVTPGGGSGRSIVAYDKLTGERIWGALDDAAAYTSPMMVTLLGERQLLVVTAERMAGLRVETGELLWSFPWTTMYEINSAQPIVVDDQHVFISAGYDHGSALVRIEKKDGGYLATRVWENRNLKNRFNSSVLYDGYIYGFDESIFACIDARTGERKWKGGRYGYGQALLIPGSGAEEARIIITTESGDLVLLKPSPDSLQELARISALEGKTWNHPAIAEGILLVRNTREMAAFDLRVR